jgi:hypothetical protein
MSIKHGEFGNTMRPNTWVGSFVMNVFCEALAYDQNREAKPKIKKGFLTSAEVVSNLYKFVVLFYALFQALHIFLT